MVLYEWTAVGGQGREVANWPVRTYRAEKLRRSLQVGVRIVLAEGRTAILSGPRGIQHPSVRATIDAVVEHALLD